MVKRVEVWQADVEWPDDHTMVVLAADYDAALATMGEEIARHRFYNRERDTRVAALEAALRFYLEAFDGGLLTNQTNSDVTGFIADHARAALAPESPKGG